MPGAGYNGSLPDEPLAESAPLMYEMALQHCLPDSESGESCHYYHAAWQFLRALGLVKKLGGQSQFVVEVLSQLAAAGSSSRVLIAAAADYSMAAHVIHAYRASELALTLVDRCKTPLVMTSWYGSRVGLPITLVQDDLLAYESAAPCDIVVTSSLLANFSGDERMELFRGFWQLLRPGGKLVFTNQIDREAGSVWAFDESSVVKLGAAARQAALNSAEKYGFDADVVEAVALEYGRRRRTYPTPSAAELLAALPGAGFTIDRFDVVDEGGRPGAQILGPSMDEARRDARVVAVRA